LCTLVAYASSTWGAMKGAAIRNVLCWSRADNADTQTVKKVAEDGDDPLFLDTSTIKPSDNEEPKQ
jgi:hypothetical protein